MPKGSARTVRCVSSKSIHHLTGLIEDAASEERAMNVRTILRAGMLILYSLSGFAVYKVAHREERIASATPVTAPAADGLQGWAASKTSLGLGFPLDKGSESTVRLSQAYDPVEWKGWQAMRDRFVGAHEIRVTVVKPPHVSAERNDVGSRDVELSIRVAGRFDDGIRTEQATVHMTVVPGSNAEHESFRLIGMAVEP